MKRFFLFATFVILLTYWFFLASKVASVNAAAIGVSSASLTPSLTATPSPTMFQSAHATVKSSNQASATPFVEPTSTPLPPGQSGGYLKPRLESFISVPTGPVPQPYVILSGFQTFNGVPAIISVNGTIGSKVFNCETSPCRLAFPMSGTITFRAQNGTGDVSDDNQASIVVTRLSDGFHLSIASLEKFVLFSDACGSMWGNLTDDRPAWSAFPQNPSDLNTQKTLHYLASRLMASGVVDAKDCPGGGSDGNAPNPCGLSRVKDTMIAWQNQYDFDIWLAGRDQHIPPVMLKSLLEIESQFWPVTQRLYIDEIGLGQINQLGVDVLLRTNPVLYQRVCSSTMYRCDLPYVSLSGLDRALIRGSLAMALDASCPNCQYGVDLSRSSQSIPLIAQVVYSNCMQAKSILDLHGFTASYNDYWKFTMVSYHSGFGCLQNAVGAMPQTSGEITWKDLSSHLACPGTSEYIDKLWLTLQGYEIDQSAQNAQSTPGPQATLGVIIQPETPTPLPPVPTRAPHLSTGRLVVRVFVDLNGDGVRQDNEAVDNVQVNLDIAGSTRIMVTQQGLVIFDLTGMEIGTRGRVSLPGLYRSAPILVPDSGDLPVIFIFVKPILPTNQP
jgi:hypothetical protein